MGLRNVDEGAVDALRPRPFADAACVELGDRLDQDATPPSEPFQIIRVALPVTVVRTGFYEEAPVEVEMVKQTVDLGP
jgi:hypothetical protein